MTEDLEEVEAGTLSPPMERDDYATPAPRLEIRALSKQRGDGLAIDAVSMLLNEGEIHVVVGENGAGKSTFLKCLSGYLAPDAGEICWYGRNVTLATPDDALALGIAMIHDDLPLIPTMTVAENITLGRDDDGPIILARRGLHDKIRALARDYDLSIDPRAYVNTLTPVERVRVQLLRFIHRNALVFLLDDILEWVPLHERASLYTTLRQLADMGKTILLATRHPEDALEIGNTITVLRYGKAIVTQDATQTTAGLLERAMTGDIKLPPLGKAPAPLGAVLLSTRHLSANNHAGQPILHNVTLDVRRGEILGIAGLPEQGQTLLAEVLTGYHHHTEGQLFIGSDDITDHSPDLAAFLGIHYIPPQRAALALAEGMTVAENLALKSYAISPVATGIALWQRPLYDYAHQLLHATDTYLPLDAHVADLSPDDQQRLIVARETWVEHQLLIAVYPTHGLAPDHALAVRRALLRDRAEGRGVLLISDDSQELMALADRIAVMAKGQVIATLDTHATTVTTLNALINGADVDADL